MLSDKYQWQNLANAAKNVIEITRQGQGTPKGCYTQHRTQTLIAWQCTLALVTSPDRGPKTEDKPDLT